MISSWPLLSISIWLPILFGLLIFGFGRENRPRLVYALALSGALLGLASTLLILLSFDNQYTGMQFVEKFAWIDRFNINYYFGIDGISLWFVVLTAFATLLVVVAGHNSVGLRKAQYMGTFLVLSGMLIGAFAALDGLLFYVFFEASLIPMFIIIGIWGGPNRVNAAFKFFLYTFLGSLLMLVAILYLYFNSDNSFEILNWHKLPISLSVQTYLFFGFLAGFAVKIPMWPVHTWLPEAHVEAPTGGSVILAAIMLKLGAYGLLRFSLPILPDACRALAPMMITLSLVAIIYIGLVTLVQQDMKKLIAYSSISHMGFVTLGMFLYNSAALQGSIVQMISHGFVSAALFLCIGVLYDRMHTRLIADYGGVVNVMPRFAVFFLIFSLANCGLPGTSGFVGESLVIWGGVRINFAVAAIAALSLILAASYSLWLVKRVIFGSIKNAQVEALCDVNKLEFLLLSLLALVIIGVGVYPAPLTESMHTSVAELFRQASASKLP